MGRKEKKKRKKKRLCLLAEAVAACLALQDFADAEHQESERIPEGNHGAERALRCPLHLNALDERPESDGHHDDADNQPNR